MNTIIQWLSMFVVFLLVGCETTDSAKSMLSQSEVRSLLLKNTEIGVLKRPSSPSVEGYSGQTYKAYYKDNSTVLIQFDHSSQYIRNWFWEIAATGVLCRGPSFTQTWCRAISSNDAGGYNAKGFRTGTLRYQFRVEKGLVGLPKSALK